jgi:murein L,D-transpeptidase YcbB/YkuD
MRCAALISATLSAAAFCWGPSSAAQDAGPSRWSPADLVDLAQAVNRSAEEGLDPQDYGLSALQTAQEAGDPRVDDYADRVALALARDYREGRDGASNWHFSKTPFDYPTWLRQSLGAHRVGDALRKLLPVASGYLSLKAALARCRTAVADCSAIEINLDRWRRLPRSFSTRYLWVNVPAMRVDLVDRGRVVSSHKVIVGKPRSRTPLFQAMVTGVTVNPWWNVPCSIVDESVGKLVTTRPQEAARRGFVARRDAAGKLVVRQKPGPDNALGRIKLEMPNPYGVYLHDTPSRDLFARDDRALSHGCIRTEAPDVLAKQLVGGDRAGEIDLALLLGASRTIRLPAPIPVYVVYFTVEPASGGNGQLTALKDLYGLDRTARQRSAKRG